MFLQQDVDVTDNPILLHCKLGTTVDLKASLFVHGQLENIPFEVINEEHIWQEFIHTRLECNLDVVTNDDEKSFKISMQNLRKYVGFIWMLEFSKKSCLMNAINLGRFWKNSI